MQSTTTVASGNSNYRSRDVRSLVTFCAIVCRAWLTLLLLFALSIIMVGPIVDNSTSLRTPAQSFSLPPKWLPTDMALENYTQVFERILLDTDPEQFSGNSLYCIGAIGHCLVGRLCLCSARISRQNSTFLADHGDADDSATGDDHPCLCVDQQIGAFRYTGIVGAARALYCLWHLFAAPVFYADPQGI